VLKFDEIDTPKDAACPGNSLQAVEF